MKKTLTLLTLGFMFAGAVGCSSAPKKEEVAEEQSVSAAADIEQEEVTPVEETASEDTSSSSTSDLSLGAGSSGRGH